MSIRDLVVYFYADDGIVALTQLERLQRAFDVLTCLFNRFGLMTNKRNIVNMSCQQCHMPGSMLVEVYESQTTETGPAFLERHQRKVHCPRCRVEVVARTLLTHHQSHHDVGGGGAGAAPPPPPPPRRPKHTGYLYRNICCGSGDQYRGA